MNRHQRRAEAAKNRHTSPNNSNQFLQYQKLEQAHNNYVRQTDNNIDILQKRVQDLEASVGSLIDSVRALYQVEMIKNFTQNEYFKFCQEKIGPFTEMSTDVRLNSLLQYLEAQMFVSDNQYQAFVDHFFDERNQLTALGPGETPKSGDLVYLMWAFFENGVLTFKSQFPMHYTLGSNVLQVDEQIMKMQVGKESDVPVTFPKDYLNKDLAGKEGVLKVTIIKFKKVITPTQNQQIPITEEQKIERLQSWEAAVIE